MDSGNEIQVFCDSAKSRGATDEEIVRLLLGRGWPEEDVYRALADRFEARSGVAVPVYKRSGSAKDAFMYLLSFATLATWAIGLGSVTFTLVNQWIEDPFSPGNNLVNTNYEIADSLASVLVAFPVYLLTMRQIDREVELHPEKLESGVRKWLTYIALLLAAGTVVYDLIEFLNYFLRGELTIRFVMKVAAAFAIAGGIFRYYIGSLAKRELSETKQIQRNRRAAGIASVAVAAVTVLGLLALGGPSNQRSMQADLRTVRAMSVLAQQIKFSWAGAGNRLPVNLNHFSTDNKRNPATGQTFTYHPESGSTYELCTTFAAGSPKQQIADPSEFWAHPKGNYCFHLDAARQEPFAPFNY